MSLLQAEGDCLELGILPTHHLHRLPTLNQGGLLDMTLPQIDSNGPSLVVNLALSPSHSFEEPQLERPRVSVQLNWVSGPAEQLGAGPLSGGHQGYVATQWRSLPPALLKSIRLPVLLKSILLPVLLMFVVC